MSTFSFKELKQKALREIERLKKSLSDSNEVEAIDNALNAAFTVFHLLEWKEKTSNLISTKKARDLVENSSLNSIKILHDIVTFTKHAKISKPYYSPIPKVQSIEQFEFLATEQGDILCCENGEHLITEGSGIMVFFGENSAIGILEDAINYF